MLGEEDVGKLKKEHQKRTKEDKRRTPKSGPQNLTR